MVDAPHLESPGLLLLGKTSEIFVLDPEAGMLLPETHLGVIDLLLSHLDYEVNSNSRDRQVLSILSCNMNMRCDSSSCSERGRTSHNVRKGRRDEGR